MGISYAYTAQGIEAKGDDWPVVSPFDGTTTVTFNQATTDPGYDPTYDGMSLGEMIKAVLEEPTTRDYLVSQDWPIRYRWSYRRTNDRRS